MKVWITKWALTEGILEAEAELFESDYTALVMPQPGFFQMSCYFNKGDWHKSYEEAAKKAEAMRTKRIASLKKQIAKLEKIQFIMRI